MSKHAAYFNQSEIERLQEMKDLIKGFAKERRRIFERARKRASRVGFNPDRALAAVQPQENR